MAKRIYRLTRTPALHELQRALTLMSKRAKERTLAMLLARNIDLAAALDNQDIPVLTDAQVRAAAQIMQDLGAAFMVSSKSAGEIRA